MSPQRIQRQRTKGWRTPLCSCGCGKPAIYVGRPTKWGNPFTVEKYGLAGAIARYRLDLANSVIGRESLLKRMRDQLGGHDLMCWCPLEDSEGHRAPCHADVLLELANPGLWTPDDGPLMHPARVLPTEAEIADALIQHETSGMCHYGRTCGTCDCGRSSLSVEQLAESDAMDLDRARAVLALFADQPTEQAVRADEALLIVGQRDRGRGFDQLLREQLQDPEVRACECRSCVTPQSPTAEATQGALVGPAPRRGDWTRDGLRPADRHVGARS